MLIALVSKLVSLLIIIFIKYGTRLNEGRLELRSKPKMNWRQGIIYQFKEGDSGKGYLDILKLSG